MATDVEQPILPSISKSAVYSGISWYNLSSLQVGLITSGSLYGALIGSVLAFYVADFLGRRRELIVSAAMYLVGAIITALAPTFVIMVIGRFIYGIGIRLITGQPSVLYYAATIFQSAGFAAASDATRVSVCGDIQESSRRLENAPEKVVGEAAEKQLQKEEEGS